MHTQSCNSKKKMYSLHTHPYSLTYTLVSAHCFPPQNITGIAIAPVGAIYRSNTVKFLQISDPDLQLALHPAGTSLAPFLHKQDVQSCDIVVMGIAVFPL